VLTVAGGRAGEGEQVDADQASSSQAALILNWRDVI
jgi:hypothetical protein